MDKLEQLEKLLSESKIPIPWSHDLDAHLADADGKSILGVMWEDNAYRTCTESEEKLICALRNAAPAMLEVVKAAKNIKNVMQLLKATVVLSELDRSLKAFDEVNL